MFIKIYGRQNALVLKECYAHLRVLLYTFSKECCSLYRRMLHRGMPQLPQEMPHSFKFSTMTYEKHAVALRIWVDAVLGFNNTIFFKGTICLPLQNIRYLFLSGALSGRCNAAWGQNEIFCQSKVLFPLVHACYKNLQHRSKHTPIIWAWRNRAKLNFLSDIHWLNDIEPLIDNLQQWERLKTAGKGNSTYCLQTWTHMSENAQNIAFFTRFVGAESAGRSLNYRRVFLVRLSCDWCACTCWHDSAK